MTLLSAALIVLLGVSSAGAEVETRSEADFVKVCQTSSNLSKDICDCSAKKAKADLSPGGFAHLVATVEGNPEKAEATRAGLPLDQIMKSSTFMVRGPAACAKEAAPK